MLRRMKKPTTRREAPTLLGLLAMLTLDCRTVERNSQPLSASVSPATVSSAVADSALGSKGYEFTQDWFSERLDVWQKHILPLRDRPLSYLEIGVFEGRSALWMLDNVLTHAQSRLTAVDVFDGELKARWLRNVERSGAASKVTTIVGPSQVELRKLPLDSFDIVYVDGSHTAEDVLADAVLAFAVLKQGGLLVFDDYGWSGYPGPHDPPTPEELRPQAALDGFITAYRNSLELVHHSYQLLLRKKANPCAHYEGCSPIGRYRYLWWPRKLELSENGTSVALSVGETDLLERLLRTRPAGSIEFRPDSRLKADRGFAALAKRLELTR